MNENKRELDQLKKIMIISGQWQEFSTYPLFKVLFQKFRAVYFIVLTPMTIVSMFFTGFTTSLSKYALLAIGGILIDPVAYSYAFEWENAKRVYTKLREIVTKRDSDEDIWLFKNKTKPYWNIVKVYGICMILFIVFYEILPYFYDCYLILFTDTKEPIMMPIPHEDFLERGPKRTYFFISFNFIMTLWSMEHTFISFGFESLVCLITTYLCVELEIIDKRLKTWGVNGGDKAELCQIIKEHQEFMKLKEDINQLFGPPIASQNTLGPFALTAFAYLTLIKEENYIFVLIVNGISLFVTFMVITLTCYVGDNLADEGERFFQSLYEVPWYGIPKSECKALSIMMRQAIKPMAINFKGWSPLNLVTLQNVLNSTYSYFNQ